MFQECPSTPCCLHQPLTQQARSTAKLHHMTAITCAAKSGLDGVRRCICQLDHERPSIPGGRVLVEGVVGMGVRGFPSRDHDQLERLGALPLGERVNALALDVLCGIALDSLRPEIGNRP